MTHHIEHVIPKNQILAFHAQTSKFFRRLESPNLTKCKRTEALNNAQVDFISQKHHLSLITQVVHPFPLSVKALLMARERENSPSLREDSCEELKEIWDGESST
ncbi:hypothetical protein CEXT_589751 [Caerostris extrusa]|uniref:Uncharacterized protein n=1 Tax=Caerostris extrusa TaxID=172846 RepID=A0AAV4P189_CAEEX|nr:hypothetical protein CEXT_589751 [Caerostris extrusa]